MSLYNFRIIIISSSSSNCRCWNFRTLSDNLQRYRDGRHHRRTQDFTMEGVHVVRGGGRTEVPHVKLWYNF